MSKKLLYGIAGSIFIGASVYFSYPVIDRILKNYKMEQELKEYGHTSQKEIIQNLSANDANLTSELESGVNFINRAIKSRDFSKLEYLFFADCSDISSSDKREYVKSFLSQHPRLELEYPHQEDENMIAGVSILNDRNETIRVGELRGTAPRNLHFDCSYEL